MSLTTTGTMPPFRPATVSRWKSSHASTMTAPASATSASATRITTSCELLSVAIAPPTTNAGTASTASTTGCAPPSRADTIDEFTTADTGPGDGAGVSISARRITMTSTIAPRPLRPADAPELDRLQCLAYGEGLQEPTDALLSKIALAPEFCFGVPADEDTGRLAGYLLAHPWPSQESPGLGRILTERHHDADALHLHDVAVDPACSGRGVASTLIASLVDAATTHGFEVITLVAVQDAAPFWEKQGFRPLRPAEGYDEDAVFMERRL
ncbi:GNAT family N-acetyltransferase [Lujinxingia sediminis]|uniref:GNAT family N-acetyltransferase n=2 Tax=Lujinxingia sediminis TaxID=2480984 RepID=A0ABY0CVZ0_9DELT|nr:GNAT family N-acetyltransferase [Lujinxingia sediminis]